MAKLTRIKGDATKPANAGEVGIVIPHVVNDIRRWGSGFVNAITARFGETPRNEYMRWGESNDSDPNSSGITDTVSRAFILGAVQYVKVDNDITIANMLAQHKTRDTNDLPRPPIRYGALAEAMQGVRRHCWGGKEIHCPKFGSDLAGGDWEVIEQMIQEIWVDAGVNVVIYEFEPQT